MVWFKGGLGVVFLLVGVVWILQGVGVLGGSMMSGKSIYAVLGAVVAVVGLVLLWSARRSWSRAPRPGTPRT
ncbi:MAG TPA: hypothetical protein VFN57_09010 [Thermomicrobiaceae bacterium]|nr:hypothetical protein [Thermomicrobiaceae bacterium]